MNVDASEQLSTGGAALPAPASAQTRPGPVKLFGAHESTPRSGFEQSLRVQVLHAPQAGAVDDS